MSAAGHGLHHRVVDRVEHHERRDDRLRLRRVEPARGERDVRGEAHLAVGRGRGPDRERCDEREDEAEREGAKGRSGCVGHVDHCRGDRQAVKARSCVVRPHRCGYPVAHAIRTVLPGAGGRRDARTPSATPRCSSSIALAESLGFDVAWLAEIHFGGAFSLLSNPLMVVPAIAQRTRRIRIGTAVTLLPLHHPLSLRGAGRHRRRPLGRAAGVRRGPRLDPQPVPRLPGAGGGEPRALRRGARDHPAGVDEGALQLSRHVLRGREARGRAQAAAAAAPAHPRGRAHARRASPTSATTGCRSTRERRPRRCRSSASAWRSTAQRLAAAGHAWQPDQMALMLPVHVGPTASAARDAMRPGRAPVLQEPPDDLLAAPRLVRRPPAAPAR